MEEYSHKRLEEASDVDLIIAYCNCITLHRIQLMKPENTINHYLLDVHIHDRDVIDSVINKISNILLKRNILDDINTLPNKTP